MLRSLILGCVLNLGCVTARSKPSAEVVSAIDFLHANWNTPELAQARFLGKPLVVTGLIDARRGPALDLQTDERGFIVRCWLRPDAGVATEPGRLIAVQGVVTSVDKDEPALRDCAPTWLGDRPGTPPDERQTAIAAASTVLCVAAERDRETSGVPLSHPLLPGATEVTRRLERRAHQVLTNEQASALACEHPLVTMARACPWQYLRFGSSSDLGRGSDCATDQIKAVVDRARELTAP